MNMDAIIFKRTSDLLNVIPIWSVPQIGSSIYDFAVLSLWGDFRTNYDIFKDIIKKKHKKLMRKND
jgi:hypothetical protein